MKTYSLGEVAKMLKVPPHRIQYRIVNGFIPEPDWIGSRRSFSAEDVEAIRRQLAIHEVTEAGRADAH